VSQPIDLIVGLDNNGTAEGSIRLQFEYEEMEYQVMVDTNGTDFGNEMEQYDILVKIEREVGASVTSKSVELEEVQQKKIRNICIYGYKG
jgi:hypothetical protein